MRTTLPVAVLLLLWQSFPARADEVKLTNGDRLTGRIVELTAENLLLQTELFGEVSIPRSAVASFSTDQARVVTLPDDRVVEGNLSARERQIVIQTEDELVTVPDKDVKAVRTRE